MESQPNNHESGSEQNEVNDGVKELSEMANKFDPTEAQRQVEFAKGQEQLPQTIARASEVQSIFQNVPVLAFNGARQVLEQFYTGKTTPIEGDLGFSVPRYLAENWIKTDSLPAEGFSVEHEGKSNQGHGPTGNEMMEGNDLLVNTPDGEQIQLFGMDKDAGQEGIDWQYVQIDNNGEQQTIKVETLPKFIDTFMFWSIYQKDKPSERTSSEAKKVLELSQHLTDNERSRLNNGFFSSDYASKLEYCIGQNDPDFQPSSSLEDLQKVEAEIDNFHQQKDHIEEERQKLLMELTHSFNAGELTEDTRAALHGYESQMENAFKNASTAGDFVKALMGSITDDDVYKIVFRNLK